MTQAKIRTILLMSVTAMAISGCVNGANPFARKDASSEPAVQAAPKSTRLVDRDVEAPEVFQTTDTALWDGRPSLGGVWVASPDTKDPERVIIRNTANGKFVIGALFQREVLNPGPKLQISSDAAAALGILAGQPSEVSVIALRREEAPVETDAAKPILDASETVETASLDPIAGAAAAIDRVEGKTAQPVTTPIPAAQTAAPVPPPAAAPTQTAASTSGRTIQIGIFSVEANAKRAADALKKAGMAADIRKEESKGKTLWSVTSNGDAATLTKVKGLGFPDAYFLKR